MVIIDKLNIEIFDVEVFKEDWIITFKNVKSGQYTVIHNDNYALKEFMSQEDLVVGGFNNKHYDNWIVQAIMLGADNEIVKKLNDFIIGGGNGWNYPFLRYKKREFEAFDLRDDLPINLSLKAIEGNLGLDIVESEISFDIDSKLTESELKSTIEYNKVDVDSTVRLFELREDYLKGKMTVARIKGFSEVEALGLTNAKLTAKYLDAKRVKRNDERDYVIPDTLKKERIPKEVFDFFAQMNDESISDKDLFKSKLKLEVDGMEYVYGFGGVHGARTNHFSTGDKLIINWDVTSLYPNLMIKYGYVSRNVPDPSIFKDVVDRRVKAKADGDWEVSGALKLVINTAYGAMLNQWNDLYDPKHARSVCITGQLLLSDLAFGLADVCDTFEAINFNTDGIMFAIDINELPKAYEVKEEWEQRTMLELEEDLIHSVYQKDVNNYIIEKTDGSITTKGGYVSNYDKKEKDLIVNNSMSILDKAIVNYFVHGVPAEQTIQECQDVLQFQNIAKTGHTYTHTIHEVDGRSVKVQKVNRVYATMDEKYGTIYKVKENGRQDKIANTPLNAIVDNGNEISINQIDKQWYIDLAEKRINDYKGEK